MEGDRVVILNDQRPWIATELHAREGEFKGKPYKIQVAVELPVRAA